MRRHIAEKCFMLGKRNNGRPRRGKVKMLRTADILMGPGPCPIILFLYKASNNA